MGWRIIKIAQQLVRGIGLEDALNTKQPGIRPHKQSPTDRPNHPPTPGLRQRPRQQRLRQSAQGPALRCPSGSKRGGRRTGGSDDRCHLPTRGAPQAPGCRASHRHVHRGQSPTRGAKGAAPAPVGWNTQKRRVSERGKDNSVDDPRGRTIHARHTAKPTVGPRAADEGRQSGSARERGTVGRRHRRKACPAFSALTPG